jgi:hypothetical protein
MLLASVVTACATNGEAALKPPVSAGGVFATLPDRTSCAAIGTSDLRSPQEGIWYQTHCLAVSAFPQGVATTDCNRLALDGAEFSQAAPGLYVYRPTAGSTAYLWLATTPVCFDIVSARVVTFVCSDRTVSFKWDARAACAEHGGILARINAP